VAERHTLGGRVFLTVQVTSVKHDHMIQTLIREAGIDQVFYEADDTAEDYGLRVLETAIRSGAALGLLGCFLVPETAMPRRRLRLGRRPDPGTVWTPGMAEQTAAYLGDITDPLEKAKVNSLVLSLLISFFDSGAVSIKTTKTSSVPEGAPATEMSSTGDPSHSHHGQDSS
jgi:hypothetical protein